MDLTGNAERTDRWSLWPGLASLVTVAALTLVCRLPGTVSFIMIPISLLSYGIGAVVIAATTVFLVLRKRPKRGASILLVLLIPVLLWWPTSWGVDMVHLGLTVGFGVGQLGGPSKSSGSDFAAYDWSVGLAGSNTFIIHDVTDDIALPMAQHTHSSRSENGFEEECACKVRSLIGHYYVCTP